MQVLVSSRHPTLDVQPSIAKTRRTITSPVAIGCSAHGAGPDTCPADGLPLVDPVSPAGTITDDTLLVGWVAHVRRARSRPCTKDPDPGCWWNSGRVRGWRTRCRHSSATTVPRRSGHLPGCPAPCLATPRPARYLPVLVASAPPRRAADVAPPDGAAPYPASRWRATTRRMISLVPSRMRWTRVSRKWRSMA